MGPNTLTSPSINGLVSSFPHLTKLTARFCPLSFFTILTNHVSTWSAQDGSIILFCNTGNVVIMLVHMGFIYKVDYILGDNPLGMSYMVGYGPRYPQRIHHRASSLPSVGAHPARIGCKAGSRYFFSPNPNPNLLVGAVVGGPTNNTDSFPDSRPFFQQSEPTTYINAPLVGLLAFFSGHYWLCKCIYLIYLSMVSMWCAKLVTLRGKECRSVCVVSNIILVCSGFLLVSEVTIVQFVYYRILCNGANL